MHSTAPLPSPTARPVPFDSVAPVLARVRAYTQGVHAFPTRENAEEFRAAVYRLFPSEGYGTSCVIDETGLRVEWQIWGCE